MRLGATAVLAAMLPVIGVAGCGGDDDSAEPPARSETATTRLPSQLSDPVRLRRTYTFEGRRRAVDAELAFDNLTDPYRSGVMTPAAGTRWVSVQLLVLNRGPQEFPLEWARMRGYDERGRALPKGVQSTEVRKTTPGRPVRGQVLASLTAFQVPRGSRLAAIRMSSIVDAWPFRARWMLRQPGR